MKGTFSAIKHPIVDRAKDLIWIDLLKPALVVGPLLCRRAETVRTKPLLQSHRRLHGPGGPTSYVLSMSARTRYFRASFIGFTAGRIYWVWLKQEYVEPPLPNHLH